MTDKMQDEKMPEGEGKKSLRMPERIWAWPRTEKHTDGWLPCDSHGSINYIRHDLHQSTLTELQAARAVIESCEAALRSDYNFNWLDNDKIVKALADIAAFKKGFGG